MRRSMEATSHATQIFYPCLGTKGWSLGPRLGMWRAQGILHVRFLLWCRFPLSSTFPPYPWAWLPLLSRLKLSWDSETEYPRYISSPCSLHARHFLFATHQHPKSTPDQVILLSSLLSATQAISSSVLVQQPEESFLRSRISRLSCFITCPSL